MKAIKGLRWDGRRSQRGSVLSGVMILTAFVAIIAGALLTELSTNFILSSDLMSRVDNEATVTSAVELSLSQLQSSQLYSAACPTPSLATVNNRTAVATYSSCWPAVDRHSPSRFQQYATGSSFSVEGIHAQVGSLNDYVVGNSGGQVFDFNYGSANPRWSISLGGSVTGPPLVITNPHASSQFLIAIPLTGSGCPSSGNCLSVRNGDLTTPPGAFCTISLSSGPDVTQPAASLSSPGVAFYAYGSTLEANDISTAGAGCDWETSTSLGGTQPIAAGPLAFRNGNSDFVYVIASDNNSSYLAWYQYTNTNFVSKGSLTLPWGKIAGVAPSSSTLPANLAISNKDGGVALVQITTSGTMNLFNQTFVPTTIAGAPYWCSTCSSPIGVGGANGKLYLFDSSLDQLAASASGSPISTAPGADGSGNWYFGSDDGTVHELQQVGSALTQVQSYGAMARFSSSVQVGACPAGTCMYLGATNGSTYLVPLDARDVVVLACISATPPACSGSRPRLWAQVEVGAQGNPQAIHVQGWSYYSP